MQNILDFSSAECRLRLGENLHWARNEQRLSIEQAAAKAHYLVQEIDELETSEKPIDLNLLCKLLQLYNEKLVIDLEGYND